jgi:Ca2+-binding EF-hand superfamily protein
MNSPHPTVFNPFAIGRQADPGGIGVKWLAFVLVLFMSLPADAQSERLLVLTDRRPAVLELQITLEGKPYSEAWEAYVDRLFRDLDLNGDGWLSPTEAARAPTADFVASFLHGALNLEAAAATIPFDQLDASHQGKVSRLDLGHYYRRTGLHQVSLTVGPEREQSLALTDALFYLLGKGSDGISLHNLKHARELLQRVDLNNDEWVTPDEILLHAPEKLQEKDARPSLESLGVFSLRGTSTAAARSVIRARFPSWNEREPEMPVAALAMRLGTHSDIELIGGAPACARFDSGGVRLTVDGLEVDVKIGPGTVSRALGMHAYYRQQFQAADSARRGFVEAKQIEDLPALRALFRLADRDGDGRLTSKEFEAFLTLHADGLQSFVSLTASDRSPGLFELLDENGDGRLSLRELHTAWERLHGLVHNKEGTLERKDLPRRLELQASRGGPSPRISSSGSVAEKRATPRGPAWFRRMDRNGDGYVSRREFLGSIEDFKKLDLDGDGLISPEEAEKLGPSLKAEVPRH